MRVAALMTMVLAIAANAADDRLQRTAWDVLNKGLQSSNPDERKQALAAAGSMETVEAAKIVARGLQDKDPVVRQAAALVLGRMELPEAVPYLRAALDDVDEVAFAAARALAQSGDESGRRVFQEVLTGERRDAPGLITSTMREYKRSMRNPAKLALMGVKEATGAFLGPASMAFGFAQDALKDSGAAGRAIATAYLADDEDPYALTLLEWALADNSKGVRAAAAQALGKRGSADTLPRLQFLLSDTHNVVRCAAAASIIRLITRAPEPDLASSTR